MLANRVAEVSFRRIDRQVCATLGRQFTLFRDWIRDDEFDRQRRNQPAGDVASA